MSVISLPGVFQFDSDASISAKSDDEVETAMGLIRLSVFRDIRLAENAWRTMQSITAGLPGQSYDWAAAQMRRNSPATENDVAIVCGRSQNGEIQFVWPFDIVTRKGLRCLQWMGQSHASHNMGLNRLNFSRGITETDVRVLLRRAADIIGDVSAAIFKNQPREWQGIANPLNLLSHHPSAERGHMLLLDSDYDTLYRNRFSGKSRNQLAHKARMLGKFGMVDYGWAHSDAERADLLSELFQQKALQFAWQGIENPFDDPDSQAYYYDLARKSHAGNAALEIAFLKVDGHAAAISSGVFYAGIFSRLVTSIEFGTAYKFSPDTLLLNYQIEEACNRGYSFFDMGAGEAGSKSAWCDIDVPLFDSAIAFEERGYLLTLPLRAGAALKHVLKHRASKAAEKTAVKTASGIQAA